MKQPVIRSYLYVPGSNQHMLEKAMSTDADALILDLEDAVAPNRKVEARHNVAQMLQTQPTRPLFVRINAINSGLAMDDIAAVAGPWLTGLRLPKTEKPEEVRLVAEQLDRLGCQAGIQCVIESAIGVERAYEIASAHSRITTLGVGEADLAADLGISIEDGFAYIRSRIVVAARAAGLAPPVQSVYTNIRDLEGLRLSTERGKRMGFLGRSAIHPAQVAVINEVFTPTEKEIADARDLLERLDQASSTGTGAFALTDGRFVDLAIVEFARRVLALAQHVQKGTSQL